MSMDKKLKFLLLISIIILGSIWYLSVKKDSFREEEVSLLHKKFIQDTVNACLQKKGVEAKEICRKEAKEKWDEAVIMNTE